MKIIDPSTYKLPSQVRNILLIQLGDIGDVVWTTPTIRAAKSAIPDGKLSILVREGFGSLLEADPSLDRVFEAKHYPGNLFRQAVGQFTFLGEIRARHFDLAVDLRLGDRGAFLSLASGAPIRVTMHHTEGLPFWRPFCFTHSTVPVGDGVIRHRGATEQILRIVRPLGMDTRTSLRASGFQTRLKDVSGKFYRVKRQAAKDNGSPSILFPVGPIRNGVRASGLTSSTGSGKTGAFRR